MFQYLIFLFSFENQPYIHILTTYFVTFLTNHCEKQYTVFSIVPFPRNPIFLCKCTYSIQLIVKKLFQTRKIWLLERVGTSRCFIVYQKNKNKSALTHFVHFPIDLLNALYSLSTKIIVISEVILVPPSTCHHPD